MSDLYTWATGCEAWLHACKGTSSRISNVVNGLHCHGGTGSVDLRAFTPDSGATPGDGLFYQGVLQPLYLAQQQELLNGVGAAGKGFGFWLRCRRASGSNDETPPGYGTGEDSGTAMDMIDALKTIYGVAGAILMDALGNYGRCWLRCGGPEVDLGPGRWDNTSFGPNFDSGEADPNGTEENRTKMRRFSQLIMTEFIADMDHVRLCAPGLQRCRLLGKSFSSLSTVNQYAYQTQAGVLEDALSILSATPALRERNMIDIHYGSAGFPDCSNTAKAVRDFLTDRAGGVTLCMIGSWETGVVSVGGDAAVDPSLTPGRYAQMAQAYLDIYNKLFDRYGMNMMTFRPNSPESGDFVYSSVYSDSNNPGTPRTEIYTTARQICACARRKAGE